MASPSRALAGLVPVLARRRSRRLSTAPATRSSRSKRAMVREWDQRLFAAKGSVIVTLIRRCLRRQPGGTRPSHGGSNGLRRAHAEAQHEAEKTSLAPARFAHFPGPRDRNPLFHRRLSLR